MTTSITDADVKALITTSKDTTPFIGFADMFVSDVIGSALATDRLEAIRTWLAAHFVYIAEANAVLSSRKGSMSEDYFPRYSDKSTGLATTQYGKVALQLDTTGLLAAATTNNGLKAQFKVYQQRQCLPPDFWLFGMF